MFFFLFNTSGSILAFVRDYYLFLFASAVTCNRLDGNDVYPRIFVFFFHSTGYDSSLYRWVCCSFNRLWWHRHRPKEEARSTASTARVSLPHFSLRVDQKISLAFADKSHRDWRLSCQPKKKKTWQQGWYYNRGRLVHHNHVAKKKLNYVYWTRVEW